MPVTQRYKLNIVPEGTPVVVHASQYDAQSRDFYFTIYNGSELFEIPSGSAVTVRGTKPDNTGFEYSATYSGSLVHVIVEAQMTVLPGNVRSEIRITNGAQILGTANFILRVESAGLSDDTQISETELPLIEKAAAAGGLVAQVENLSSNLRQAEGDIDALSARMDEFSSLEEGSTTGDAELADIRVGYDGDTYANAGSAVRGQFADISERGNITIPASEFVNGNIGADGKNIDSNARSRVEKYYRATAGTTVSSVSSNINFGVYEYDMYGSLIYHHSGWITNREYTVTQDCYIRIMQQAVDSAKSDFVVNRKLDIRDTSLSDNAFGASQLMNKYSGTTVITEDNVDLLNVTLDANGYDYALNSTTRQSTPFLPCEEGDQFQRFASGTIAYNIFFYNSKKEFIGKGAATGSWVSSQKVVEAPTGSAYFRIMQNMSGDGATWAGYYHFEKYKLEKRALNSLAIEALSNQTKWNYPYLVNGSHRGYMAEAPQSTKPAYIIAKNKGYNTIEADIRITSDGQFVIHHNVGMPSDSSYLIADHTLQELRENANMGTYKGEVQQILTLDELLVLANCLDVQLYLEFKATPSDAQYKEIVQLVTNRGMIERVWFMVANSATADKLRASNPKARLAWISATTDQASTIAAYNLNHTLDNQVYRRCDLFTTEFVSAFNALDIACVGWSVDWNWMYGSGYTIEQVKADIVNSIKNGALGIVTDIFTLDELMREEYAL